MRHDRNLGKAGTMKEDGCTPISQSALPVQRSLTQNPIPAVQRKDTRNKQQRSQYKISKNIREAKVTAQEPSTSPSKQTRYTTRSITRLSHQSIQQITTPKAPDKMPHRSVTINRRTSNASNASNSSSRRESTAAWTTQENVQVTGVCGSTNCQWWTLSRYDCTWQCGKCLFEFHSRCFFAHQNTIRGRGKYMLDCPNCGGEEGAFDCSWAR